MTESQPCDVQVFLSATYVGHGNEETIPGGVQCYVVGSTPRDGPCRGIIVLPDVRGFDGGRTRGIADLLARETAHVVLVPKLLCPPLERGTRGDGVPEEFDDVDRQDELHAWLKHFPWQGCLDQRINAVLTYLKTLGASKIAVVGGFVKLVRGMDIGKRGSMGEDWE